MWSVRRKSRFGNTQYIHLLLLFTVVEHLLFDLVNKTHDCECECEFECEYECDLLCLEVVLVDLLD